MKNLRLVEKGYLSTFNFFRYFFGFSVGTSIYRALEIKVKKATILRQLFASFLMLLNFFFLPHATSAQNAKPRIHAPDIVVGESNLIRVYNLWKNEEVKLYFVMADGSDLLLEAQSDEEGYFDLELYAYHTQVSGIYQVELKNFHGLKLAETSFKAIPKEIDVSKSSISAKSRSIKADGQTATEVSIYIADLFGNPIPSNPVKLISSRPMDLISNEGKDFTNSKGIATFKIRSGVAGISTLTVIDEVTNEILDDRLEIIFFSYRREEAVSSSEDFLEIASDTQKKDAISTFQTVGNSQTTSVDSLSETKSLRSYDSVTQSQERNLRLALEDVGGDTVVEPQSTKPVQSFEILGLDSDLTTGEAYDFIVKAADEDGGRVTNYVGTIEMSVTDPQGEILDEYEFLPQELGQHKFALGVKFLTTGEQKLTVNDLENPEFRGEVIVQVSEAATTPPATEPIDDNLPRITSPQDGDQTNQSSLEIAGVAAPGTEIVFFDGNSEIATFEADLEGNFSYQLENITDGQHVFSVMSIASGEESGPISENVEVAIDTTPPEVDSFKVEPAKVAPGENVQFILESEAGLKSAVIEIDGNQLPLEAGEAGIYRAEVVSTPIEGTYQVNVTLVDAFDNEKSFSEAGEIVVAKTPVQEPPTQEPPDPTPPTDSRPAPPEEVKPDPPSQVSTQPGEASATISWNPPSQDIEIDHYRVYFGISPTELHQTKDTADTQTRMTVPGLINGIDYYFAVATVLPDGTESVKSLPAKVTPQGAATPPQPVKETNIESPDSGPETLFSAFLAFVVASLTWRIMAGFKA